MKLRLTTLTAMGLAAATLSLAGEPMMGGGAPMGGPGGGGPMGGQMGGGGGPGGQRDSFMQQLYSAEMVMHNHEALNLSEEQKTVLKEVLQEQGSEFATLQFEQTEAQSALGTLIGAGPIDLELAMAEFDKLVSIESKIKRLQITGMIKIRNVLTAEQVATLKEKKQSMRPRGPMGPMGGNRPPLQPPAAANPETPVSDSATAEPTPYTAPVTE